MHWIGCIWFLLVGEKDTWIPPKDLDSGETNFYEVSKLSQYSVMFYYGLLLIFGNESAPRNNPQTVFSSLVIILGALVTAFIFGNIANIVK